MMKRFITLLLFVSISVFSFIGVPYAYATWVGVDDFNSYSNNVAIQGLNGGSGWSGAWGSAGTRWVTTNTQTYEGSEAATFGVPGNQGINRTLTSTVTSGVYYIAIRMGQTSGGGYTIPFRNGSAQTVYQIQVDTGGAGTVKLGGSTTVTVIPTIAANTWYVIRLTFNTSGNTTAATSTAAYQSGGSYSSDTSSVSPLNAGPIASMEINSEIITTEVYYVDYISGTDPLPAPPVTTSTIGLVKSVWIF